MTLGGRNPLGISNTLALGTNLASLTLAPEEENLEEMHYVLVHVERIKKHMLRKLEGTQQAGLEVDDQEEILQIEAQVAM
jgi:hypothetical protein